MTSDRGRMSTYERNGMTFDVTDSGPADGTPVVLLHGFPTDRTSWRHVEPLLHEAGQRTYAPDQRGYSPGARPGGRTAYRMEQLVADVIALVDATGHEQVHLVGHDWGAAVAWLLAGNHPDRVTSLTALSTPHPRAMTQALRGEQALRSWYMAAFQLPFLPEALLGARFRKALSGSGLPDEDLERYAARLASRAALAGPINWYRAIPLSRIRARRVTVPTTYVWGSGDFAL
ncbi:MAG TPA: alpha/beta fold hydrolase, partial [Intrasporangium sp.]|uniref:alpha/beta fold hydrolase n=1 Tax=Intrasporangium sp. TaxID=1925024 RepID=UPI002D767A56